MGQGKNYKRKKSSTIIKVEPRFSDDGISSENGETLLECFQFLLEEPSELVKEVVKGDSVFGDFSDDRILILGTIGVLGYAPKNKSKIMISISEKKQIALQGTIIKKIGNENVEVEICL